MTGATSLNVNGIAVQLFGVRDPLPDDICGAYHCVNVARVTLQSALLNHPQVSCRAPRLAVGATTAICLDWQGADLGGYLVGEGLARADTAESRDYAGAERIARDLRRGMWAR